MGAKCERLTSFNSTKFRDDSISSIFFDSFVFIQASNGKLLEAVNRFTSCCYDARYHDSFSAAALAFAPLAFFSGVSFLVLLD